MSQTLIRCETCGYPEAWCQCEAMDEEVSTQANTIIRESDRVEQAKEEIRK
jgi:hypothetical protein